MTPNRRHTRLFFTAYGVSIFGNGLVFPLTAIFLHEELGLSAGRVSVYFVIAAVSGMVVNPLVGMWCDRRGPYRAAAAAVTAQAIGPIVLATAGTAAQAWSAAVLTGAGTGAFYAVQTPLIAALFGREAIGPVYARQYVIMNAATGVAGILSGWAVGQWGHPAYQLSFVYNGLSFLVYAAIVLGLVAGRGSSSIVAADPGTAATADAPSRPWHPYLDRAFLPLLAAQLIISGFAFTQMDSVLPVVFREVGDLPVVVVGVFLTVNAVTVVLLQGRVGRLAAAWGNVRSLRVMFVIWGVSFALGAASMMLPIPPAVRIALVLAFSVVFAVGECLLSPSFNPLVAERSPTHLLGSYSAAASLVYSLGFAVGPAVMLPLFDTGAVFWGMLLGAMALGLLSLHSLDVRPAAGPAPAERETAPLQGESVT